MTKKKAYSPKRSLSRLMATQILYQRDFLTNNEHYQEAKRDIDEIKNDVIENYALTAEQEPSSYRKKVDENFLHNLVNGVTTGIEEIDTLIANFLKDGWSIETIDDISRQILRCGTFELKFINTVPARVVIDEYVDIAASFFEKKKVTFINATLDAIAKKLRSEEFVTTKKT